MDTLGALISWAVFGFVVGAIARFVVPGRVPLGCLYTILLGVAGSLMGGMISWLVVSGGHQGMYEPSGWIMSIIGAVIVILIGRRMTRL